MGVLVGAVDAQAEADVGAVGTTTMMIDETMVVVVVVGTRVDLVREEEEDDSRMNLEGRREMGRESLSRTTRGSTRDHRTGILVGLLRLRRGIMGHHRVDMVDHRHRLLLYVLVFLVLRRNGNADGYVAGTTTTRERPT